MHCGHPDVMNNSHITQQGGVPTNTKTMNFFDDIFTGADFTFRGGGHVQHHEYFHFVKGCDLRFNPVLGSFSKTSSGTGEQIRTRQMFQLGQVMGLPEFSMVHDAHAGCCLAQSFLWPGPPTTVHIWVLVGNWRQ